MADNYEYSFRFRFDDFKMLHMLISYKEESHGGMEMQ